MYLKSYLTVIGFAHTWANDFPFYERCGFEVKDLSKNGTCAYYEYIEAHKNGHRL